MEIYCKHGNIQLLGKTKILDKQFNNLQIKNLLCNNIEWKDFIQYQQGQICSKYINGNINFYYSLINNNKNNDPEIVSNIGTKWNSIDFGSNISSYINFDSIDSNYYLILNGYYPIFGLKSNTGNFYSITNQVQFSNNKTKLNLRPFLIAQNVNVFSGTWTAYLSKSNV